MFYSTPTQFGLTFDQVRKLFPQLSLRLNGEIQSEELNSYKPAPTPDYNPSTHCVHETAPVDGVQQWALKELSDAEKQVWQDSQVSQVEAKIDALWRATDAYIAQYISGVAIGILTLGVAQMKPKAMQVSEWTQMIWGNYYQRKANVTATSVDDHDYTAFGPIPFSIQELKEEAGL